MKTVQTFFLVLLSLLIVSAGVKAQTFTDVAIPMGIDHSWNGSFFAGGVSFADINMDGKDDITLSTQTTENMMIFRNRTTDFRDRVTPMGISELFRSKTVLWADYDNDGERDLLVVNANEVVRLYHNSGNGTHTDVTATCGMSTAIGEFSGAAWADYDNDGWLDLYVGAHDFALGNILYHNNGDGTFTDVTATAGVANFGKMNLTVSWFDFNNDGFQDIYSANDLNIGNTLFDLFVSVSDGPTGPGDPARTNVFYTNNGNGTFTVNSGSGLMTDNDYSYGNAIGDFNNDGWQDLVVLNANGTKTKLYQNSGGANNWIKILLSGTSSNFDGFGSVIEVYQGGSKFIRTTHSAVSFESQNSRTNTIGVGTATVIDSIRILWPSGIVDVLRDVPVGQLIDVVEGTWAAPIQHFRDVAIDLGIDHTYNVDFMGAGVSFVDFNKDGLDDITLGTEGGNNIEIFRNKTPRDFKNVVTRLGLSETSSSRTIIWVDYDNDGDKDLFIANADNVSHLYRRDSPSSFTDVTATSGLSTANVSTMSAAWADYDNDGWLDVYIGNRVNSLGNYLYHNNGDGTFTDVTTTAGVSNFDVLNLTVTWLDFNNDGYQDIYLANDFEQGNTLFKNNGDGTFADVSVSSGADLHFAAMGLAVGDYNNDGFVDIYVSNSPVGNGLLKNNGDGTFTDVASSLGLLINKICWGGNFVDYDNDGDLDLFVSVSHGNGMSDPESQNVLFANNGDGTFSTPVYTWINLDKSQSYGNAIGDFNNDGFSDIAVVNGFGTKTTLWKNSGNTTNHWIKLNLMVSQVIKTLLALL
ncbi:MAG: VCBS repeat-containing protein [Ignavibacteriales bacterium]|nr:VCBS repeat-containing protein [Ignavibacteriales bacterium]